MPKAIRAPVFNEIGAFLGWLFFGVVPRLSNVQGARGACSGPARGTTEPVSHHPLNTSQAGAEP